MHKTFTPLRLLRTFVATACLFSALPALAQWQWIDGTGRKVFSDTAPPASVPDKNILKRPGTGTGPVSAAPEATPTAAAAPPALAAPQISGRDSELEARKKEAEAAEQARKKAEADKVAQVRAENCTRAQNARKVFESGQRVATTNAKGEREVMDDAMRAAEVRRIDQVIQNDCGPMPK